MVNEQTILKFLQRCADKVPTLSTIVLLHRDGESRQPVFEGVQTWLTDAKELADRADGLAVEVVAAARSHARTVGLSRVSFVLKCVSPEESKAIEPQMSLRVDDEELADAPDVADGGLPKDGTTAELARMLMSHLQVKEKIAMGAELRQKAIYEGIIMVMKRENSDLRDELRECYKLLRSQANQEQGVDPEKQARIEAVAKVSKDITDVALPMLEIWAYKQLGLTTEDAKAAAANETPPGTTPS